MPTRLIARNTKHWYQNRPQHQVEGAEELPNFQDSLSTHDAAYCCCFKFNRPSDSQRRTMADSPGPEAKPAQARAKPSPPSGLTGPRAQGLKNCKPSQARKPWPGYWGENDVVMLRCMTSQPKFPLFQSPAVQLLVRYWDDCASVTSPERDEYGHNSPQNQELASTQARPGQAMLAGLGSGLKNPKPKLAQAKPKPWLSGQARPGHHYPG
ncbi:hypothetical protein DFH06DRAFT_1130908 [Mycena polygramma]|nr:hypothetical protein DFH06DRAFT_1130908 [Mycena polygramma]